MSKGIGSTASVTYVTEADSKVGLPPRYGTRWQQPFEDAIVKHLREDTTVLDVGSGRNPAVAPEERPAGVHYVGLDLSADELAAAGTGAYDGTVVADATTRVPHLVGTVDLVVSWQVFEHVKPLDAALNNMHAYLRPGGVLVSFFSGGLSVFGVVNRLIPHTLGTRVVEFSMRRKGTAHPVFPAYYDRCTERSLRTMTRGWSEVKIHPFFRGATYFHFSGVLTRAYLAYENSVRRARLRDLATHYLLIARH